MDEIKGNERGGTDQRGNESDAPKKFRNLAEVDTKVLLFVFNALSWVLAGFVLWQFSIQFEKHFIKHITPIEDAHKTEHQYIKRDISKQEEKDKEHDQRIRHLEINRGGK